MVTAVSYRCGVFDISYNATQLQACKGLNQESQFPGYAISTIAAGAISLTFSNQLKKLQLWQRKILTSK